jgi:hypothetical protein
MRLVMKTCVILHNMIVEDGRNTSIDNIYNSMATNPVEPDASRCIDFSTFVRNLQNIHNSELHYSLRNNLISHLWARKGRDDNWGIEDKSE